MGAHLEFAILGPLEVRRDGAPVAIGGPRQRALLVLLLCQANRVVSRDRLVAELMDERTVEDGDHALRVQISRLRKALAAEQRLLTRAPGYLLRVEPDELDLQAFEDRVARSRQALEQGDPARAVALLREAEALWRGPPLAGLEPGPSTRLEVQRLEELRMVAVEDRIDAELTLGRHAALCPELEALVAQHPLRERLRAQLMLALYREGRQADALAAYRDARTRLVEELALEPGPQLRRLEQAILRHDSALELDGDRPAPAAGGPAPPSRRRVRRRTAVAVGLLAAVAAAAIAPTLGSAPRRRADPRGNVLALVSGNAIRARVRLAGAPQDVSAGFGSLWVAEPRDGIVERVDPGHRRVVATIPVGRRPSRVLAAAGRVWVLDPRDRSLSRIDPATDTVARTISVGRDATGLAAGGGSLWVVNHGDGTVWRIAPRTGRIRVIRVGTAPRGVAATAHAVWVTDDEAGSLVRIDAATGAVTDRTHVGDGPTAVAAAGSDVWVVDPLDATLSRIDARRAAVTARFPLSGRPGDLALSRGAVWVADEDAGTLQPFPGGRPVDLGGRPLAVTAGLWAAVGASGAGHRGGTLTTLPSTLEVDTIDPAAGSAQNISPTSLLGLTNDGLVTLDHVAGPDGSRLVPDLALTLPPPRDHGRSYTFRLRPGIRYSTGSPVRATDVRHSFERIFAMGSSAADNYLAIAGAALCKRRPARCDLSRGIVADDGTGTVTFRLTRPDPDFEAKLALIYAAVLPASVPGREARAPLPATGPYMIDRYLPAHELRLVRNPRFREWSAAAQPDGYPAAIVLRFDIGRSAGTAAVAAGRVDLMSNIGGAPVLGRAAQRARLRVDPLAGTQFLFLNVAAPPFDDVRVRRALNLALDRGRIAQLDGGRRAAQPTCQVLPPQLPGYRPYCPYTRHPTPDGRWHGADLRRARRLVAASGTRGMKVAVWDTRAPQFAVNEGRVTVATLRRLGYRAGLRLLPDSTYFSYVNDSRNRAQVIDGGWGVDYPSTNGFISRLSCRYFVPADAPSTSDASEFCDPAVDRRLARAARLQSTDPAAAVTLWTRLDRELTDRAIWLPTTIADETDLLSRRAGDYRYNPLDGVLLDQLWVR